MEGGDAYSRFERSNEDSTAFNFLHLDVSFLRIARCGAVATAIGILLLPITSSILIAFPADFVALYVVGGLLGAIELPVCFSCIATCRKVQACLEPIEIYWMRGIFYILLAVMLLLVNHFATRVVDIWCWLSAIAVLVVGVLYLVAFANGERCAPIAEPEIEEPWMGEERQSSLAWMRNIFGGSREARAQDSDIQRAALRAAMSTAM